MKPKPKTAERMSFCRRGSLMVQTTGMGRRKIRKSVTAIRQHIHQPSTHTPDFTHPYAAPYSTTTHSAGGSISWAR